jgi:uncharacterized protein (DUF305 family)
MKRALAVSVAAVVFAASGGGSGLAAPASPAADETAYMAQNQQAMDKMMAGMNVKPSGDVDRDFAAMMIPHHQGAIDMAVLELRYGHNEQLRRLAQGIIVDQQQEIVVMRHVLADLPSPAQPAPDRPAPGMTMPMGGQGASQ